MVERKTLNLVVVGSIPTGGAFSHVRAFLAEWSKALDLSSSIGFDAEVRTLQEALTLLPSPLTPTRVGATAPVPMTCLTVAQLVERRTVKLKASARCGYP